MNVQILTGDLLDQKVDVIVNAWNQNIIPWWLLSPHGVSKAIKNRAGTLPFRELDKQGKLRLGQAILTSAGKLSFQGIIHVAGINLLWKASEKSIQDSVRNAINIAKEKGFHSIAFPIIGSGSGNFDEEQALKCMNKALDAIEYAGLVVFVRYPHKKDDN
jgi:O-acetyl-ADP-ribose deacetylase (regulator of RNase III)